jgi:hypothetical protein
MVAKKTGLIVIVALLSLAPVTSATISLYMFDSPAHNICVPLNELVTIQVYSDNILPWVGYIIVDDYWVTIIGTLTNPQSLSTAGVLGNIQPYSERGWGSGYRMTTDGSGIQVGVQHTADFLADWEGVSFISLWDEALGLDVPVDYFNIWAGPCIGDFIFAEADGPYEISRGETVTLSGRHSWSSSYIYEWRWSIDDNFVGDAEILEVSYDTLVDDIGLDLGEYEVELRVRSAIGDDYDYTTIEIIPEPSTFLLLVLGGLVLYRKGKGVRQC